MTVTNSTPLPSATILGYPRIGPDRELKRALEAYWADPARHPAQTVLDTLGNLRERTTLRLRELGLTQDCAVPSEGFAVDHVLDTALALGAVPARFRAEGLLPAAPDTERGIELITALSRGTDDLEPLELTKWFDTNYHYYVPEIDPGTALRAHPESLVSRYRDTLQRTGVRTRPVLVGPEWANGLRPATHPRATTAPRAHRPPRTGQHADRIPASALERYTLASASPRLVSVAAGWSQHVGPQLCGTCTPTPATDRYAPPPWMADTPLHTGHGRYDPRTGPGPIRPDTSF